MDLLIGLWIFLQLCQGHLRREPTPFPKEMRAMAKRMQNLRQTGKEASVTMSHGGSEYRRVTRWSSWRYYLGAQLWCQKSCIL